jgi:hypothetical protein
MLGEPEIFTQSTFMYSVWFSQYMLVIALFTFQLTKGTASFLCEAGREVLWALLINKVFRTLMCKLCNKLIFSLWCLPFWRVYNFSNNKRSFFSQTHLYLLYLRTTRATCFDSSKSHHQALIYKYRSLVIVIVLWDPIHLHIVGECTVTYNM